MAAYERVSQRETAREEYKELMAGQTKPGHALVFGFHQASPWLSHLQTDPEIGRGLGVLLERARQFGAGLPQVRRVFTAACTIHSIANGYFEDPGNWQTRG